MKTSSEQHIDDVIANKIRPLLEEAANIIEALKPGEKIPATKLSEQVAALHDMTGPQLYPTLLFLFKNYPNRIIKRGAHGGIENPLPDDKKTDDTQK